MRQEEFKISANEQGNWVLTDPELNTVLAEEKLDEDGNKIDPSFGMAKSITLDDASDSIIIDGVYEKDGIQVNVVTARAQSIEDFKLQEDPMRFRQNEVYYATKDGETRHFVVIDPPEDINPTNFDPFDEIWSSNFKAFTPQLVDENDPSFFFKKSHPNGYESYLKDGSLVELNIGIAEALINDG